MDEYPQTGPASEGAVDLALIYRELGLFESAQKILVDENRRLTEAGNWLKSLVEQDFLPGKDMTRLLESAVGVRTIDQTVLDRTPAFARRWILVAGDDPLVRRSTHLLAGVRRTEKVLSEILHQHNQALSLLNDQLVLLSNDRLSLQTAITELERSLARLPHLDNEMSGSLAETPLSSFSDQRSTNLISAIRTIRTRLDNLESSIGRVSGYSGLLEGLRGTITGSPEEKEELRIRERAYARLLESRRSLDDLYRSLNSLEGQVWILAKGKAIGFEKSISRRTDSASASINSILEKGRRVEGLMAMKEAELHQAAGTVAAQISEIKVLAEGTLPALTERASSVRSARLLNLAESSWRDIDRLEVRAVFTAADIEISRMERTIREMQESVR